MASISRDKAGNRRILFAGPNGARRTIYVGRLPKRDAEEILRRVEALVAAKFSGRPIEVETAAWVAALPEALAVKLVRVGLIESPEAKAKATLGPFLKSHFDSKANLKPNTQRNYKTTEKLLREHFGEGRPLASISPGDADEWREALLRRLSATTVSREVKRARQFFRAAVRKRLLTENPFADLASPAQVNTSREYFVTAADTARAIEACPDAQWRLIVALSRYGGLRCPSEHLALRWGDIDWERGRMTVRSPKTEHHPGGEARTIPLFPELRPHLEQVWDAAEPGTEFVVTRYRCTNMNLRTQFLRILRRAGLDPWPRLFHNLRASRQTELCQRFPIHVVCAWLGNSQLVAAKHYLQVTDGDFERAAASNQTADEQATQNPTRNPTQYTALYSGIEPQAEMAAHEKTPENQGFTAGCDLILYKSIPPRGVEPLFSG